MKDAIIKFLGGYTEQQYKSGCAASYDNGFVEGLSKADDAKTHIRLVGRVHSLYECRSVLLEWQSIAQKNKKRTTEINGALKDITDQTVALEAKAKKTGVVLDIKA